MISLEFGPGTSERTKDLVQSIPPYDLLVAYRQAAQAFNTTDIVLIIAVDGEEAVGFEAKPRSVYIEQAFNQAARHIHPMARATAHKTMRIPPDTPAFWLVLELRDKNSVLTCAIGAVEVQKPSEAAVN